MPHECRELALVLHPLSTAPAQIKLRGYKRNERVCFGSAIGSWIFQSMCFPSRAGASLRPQALFNFYPGETFRPMTAKPTAIDQDGFLAPTMFLAFFSHTFAEKMQDSGIDCAKRTTIRRNNENTARSICLRVAGYYALRAVLRLDRWRTNKLQLSYTLQY